MHFSPINQAHILYSPNFQEVKPGEEYIVDQEIDDLIAIVPKTDKIKIRQCKRKSHTNSVGDTWNQDANSRCKMAAMVGTPLL